MNATALPSSVSVLFQSLAMSLPTIVPLLILNAIGFTFALAGLQRYPKAAKLTMAGCVLCAVSPFFSIGIHSVAFRQPLTSDSYRYAISLLTSTPTLGAISCWVLAAFADRPSDRNQKPPKLQ